MYNHIDYSYMFILQAAILQDNRGNLVCLVLMHLMLEVNVAKQTLNLERIYMLLYYADAGSRVLTYCSSTRRDAMRSLQ